MTQTDKYSKPNQIDTVEQVGLWTRATELGLEGQRFRAETRRDGAERRNDDSTEALRRKNSGGRQNRDCKLGRGETLGAATTPRDTECGLDLREREREGRGLGVGAPDADMAFT